MWRCVNDVFGYCMSEPKRGLETLKSNYSGAMGNPVSYEYMAQTCGNDPKKCPDHRTCTQRYGKAIAPAHK